MRSALVVTIVLAMTVTPLHAGEGNWGDLVRGDGIVVDHQPNQVGGLASDTSFRTLPIPQLPEIWNWVADDFTSPVDATIRRVNFWGFYGNNIQPLGDEAFRIRFSEPRAADGLPGTLLYEESFLDLPKSATGEIVPGSGVPEEFFYQADLTTPFVAVASTQYWLEVVQVGDVDSRFRWEFSINTDLNGQAFINDDTGNSWRHSGPATSNTAFQLSTAPEPCTAVLLLLGCACLRRVRKGVSMS